MAQALAYPGSPVDSGVFVAEDLALWRCLFGTYGGAVGTSSISMPDRGRLVADAGKMQVLHALLRRLKREGHEVLVYSQFTKVAHILDHSVQATGFKYAWLDGQLALADRRDMAAECQTDDKLFVFLLSTRAHATMWFGRALFLTMGAEKRSVRCDLPRPAARPLLQPGPYPPPHHKRRCHGHDDVEAHIGAQPQGGGGGGGSRQSGIGGWGRTAEGMGGADKGCTDEV